MFSGRLSRSDYANLIGLKFGRLTIKQFIFGGKTKAVCSCDCGNETIVFFNNLRNKTGSCGCLRSEKLRSRRKYSDEQRAIIRKLRESQSKRWLRQEYKAKKRIWAEANKDKINKRKLMYHRNRLANDPCYVLVRSIRNRFKAALRGKYKSGSAVEYLGCSIEELRSYLESKFQPGMTWDNYGKWHIDHIRPLSSFDLSKKEELVIACHYTNLQPLWAEDNLRKGAKNG